MRPFVPIPIVAAALLLAAACADGDRGPAGAGCTLRDAAIVCEEGGSTPLDPADCVVEDGEDGGQVLRCPDGSSHPIAKGPPRADGAIAGMVRRYGVAAEAGIRVSIPTLDRTVETDGAGAFLLEGLPAGRYDLHFVAPGYPPRVLEGVAVTNGTRVLPPLALRWGRLLAEGTHVLLPAPDERHALLLKLRGFALTAVRLVDPATGAVTWIAADVGQVDFVGASHFLLADGGGWELRHVDDGRVVATGSEALVLPVGNSLVAWNEDGSRILTFPGGDELELPGFAIDTVAGGWGVLHAPEDGGHRLLLLEGESGGVLDVGVATTWYLDPGRGALAWVEADEAGDTWLAIRGPGQPARRLAPVTSLDRLAWAADAAVVAWLADGEAFAHAFGGEVEALGPASSTSLDVSPSGRFVRFSDGGQSKLRDRLLGVTRDLGADPWLLFSPDDRWIAWTVGGQLSVLDTDTGAIATRPGGAWIVDWIGQPARLLLAEGDDFVLRDPASGEESALGTVRRYVLDRAGERLAFSTPAGEVAIHDLAAGTQRRIELAGDPTDFSPDGAQVLVLAVPDDGGLPPIGTPNLHLVDVATGASLPVDETVTDVVALETGFAFQVGGPIRIGLGGVEEPAVAMRWGSYR